MAGNNYKKWVIIAIFIIVAVIVIIGLTGRGHRRQRPADRSISSGPILDTAVDRTGPAGQIRDLPETSEGLAALGDEYFESQRFIEAIEIYRKALDLDPSDVDTYNDLGLALHYTGKTHEAVETLKKGTEADPDYQRVWLSLGFVLTASGRGKEARPALEKAVELDPASRPGQEAKKLLEMVR